jgi:hypothetical protein
LPKIELAKALRHRFKSGDGSRYQDGTAGGWPASIPGSFAINRIVEISVEVPRAPSLRVVEKGSKGARHTAGAFGQDALSKSGGYECIERVAALAQHSFACLPRERMVGYDK